MSDGSTIEWLQFPGRKPATWNFIRGCSPASEGCANCYAVTMANRFSGEGKPFEGLIRKAGNGPQWSGVVKLLPEKLTDPLHWREPRAVFPCSVSDLFHPDVPFDFIDQAFAVMAMTPQHLYMILTKRPERMAQYFNEIELYTHRYGHVMVRMEELGFLSREDAANIAPPGAILPKDPPWPLPNVILGTSVENQRRADERIPYLLQTPAVARFLSCEPLLGPLDLKEIELPKQFNLTPITPAHINALTTCDDDHYYNDHAAIKWVITGAESGPGARPMNEDWVRILRDQCVSHKVPFFYKQRLDHNGHKVSLPELDGRQWAEYPEVEAA